MGLFAQDPEVRYGPDFKRPTTFSIANCAQPSVTQKITVMLWSVLANCVLKCEYATPIRRCAFYAATTIRHPKASTLGASVYRCERLYRDTLCRDALARSNFRQYSMK